jgi:hypothetical protein
MDYGFGHRKFNVDLLYNMIDFMSLLDHLFHDEVMFGR